MWNRSIAVLTASLLLSACGGAPVLRSQSTGDLAPCNSGCVSSQEQRSEYFVEPLRYTSGSAVAAREKLARVLRRMQGMGYEIVANEGDYLHATWSGGSLKGTEDLEFVFSQSQRGLIHVRAASRSYAGFSSSREHVEEVRNAYYVAKN